MRFPEEPEKAFDAAWDRAEKSAIQSGEKPGVNNHYTYAMNEAQAAVDAACDRTVRFPNGQVVGERRSLLA